VPVQGMFVAYGACLNGFILGSRKMVFVDRTHLSGSYKRTLLAAIALDADNHILNLRMQLWGAKQMRTGCGF